MIFQRAVFISTFIYGSVYTGIVPNCKAQTLQEIIRGYVAPETISHSDGWRGYDGLVDVGFKKHFRVNHSDNQFADGTNWKLLVDFKTTSKKRLPRIEL